MFRPFTHPIADIPVIAAIAGNKSDAGGRVYAIVLHTLRPGGEAEIWQSLVRYQAFGEKDRRRSGLTQEKLSRAPSRPDVLRELRSRLQGAPFVLAVCDLDAIPEIESFCGGARVIDLVFAAQFFYPWLSSFTPKVLWENVNRKKWATTSMSMEEMGRLGAELLKDFCGRYLNDTENPKAPALRYQLAASETLFGKVFTHINEHFREYFGGLLQPKSCADEVEWEKYLDRVPQKRPPTTSEKEQAFRPVTGDTILQRFAALKGKISGFRERPAQANYATAVAGALNDDAVLAVEAGTGTGKTYGYLVPCFEFLYQNPKARIAISTFTKNLQDQVFNGEVADLRAAFPIYKDIPTALLKGRSSYVCADKLGNALDAEGLVGEQLIAWTYFLNVLFNYRRVEINDVGERVRQYLDRDGFFGDLRNEVSAKSGCSPDHGCCPAQVISREAKNARLIVTNHYKLALLDGETALAGLFDRCIIDEANQFEDAVRGSLKIELESHEIAKGLDYLASRVLALRPELSGVPLGFLDRATALIGTVRQEMAELRIALARLASQGGQMEERWLEPANSAFHEGLLFNNLKSIGAGLKELLAALAAVLGAERTTKRFHARTVKRVASIIASLDETAGDIQRFVKPSAAESRYLTFKIWPRHWCLTSVPVDVAAFLRTNFYPTKHSVVLTSATIAYQGSLRLFLSTLGLAEGAEKQAQGAGHPCRTLVIPSPFRTDRRKIVLPPAAPSGKFDTKEAWQAYLCEVVPALVRENKGGTLVLFASYNDLELLADAIGDDLAASGFPVLVQRRGTPTAHLSEDFRAVKESVLFGATTFWYGVDFKGNTLTQVIVTRIPFANPSDPLYKGRRRLYSNNELWVRTNYDAAIKMKQGVGRLIRHEDDHGKVVVLDSRFQRFEKEAGLGMTPEAVASVNVVPRAAEVPSVYTQRREELPMFTEQLMEIPKSLDEAIVSLGGYNVPLNADFTCLQSGETEILQYIGTYMRRSFAEGYQACVDLCRLPRAQDWLAGNERLIAMDIGSGSGGYSLGMQWCLSVRHPRLAMQVEALEGNSCARACHKLLFDELFAGVNGRGFGHTVTELPVTLDWENLFLQLQECSNGRRYDVITTSKCLKEMIDDMPWKTGVDRIVSFLVATQGLVSEQGFLFVNEVTSSVSGSSSTVFFPQLMNHALKEYLGRKGAELACILPLSCAHYQPCSSPASCFRERRVAFRQGGRREEYNSYGLVLARKEWASELLRGIKKCSCYLIAPPNQYGGVNYCHMGSYLRNQNKSPVDQMFDPFAPLRES